jgi:rod shape-determining protein MreD
MVLAAALLEAGNLLNLIAIGDWHIRPAILIVLLSFFAMRSRPHEAIIASFILGLAMDISGSLMGPHTLSYCLVGSLLNQLGEHFPTRRAFHQAVLVFTVYLIAELAAYWLAVLKTGERQEYVYQILLFTAIYSACVSPFVWRVAHRINHLIAFRQPRSERGYFR